MIDDDYLSDEVLDQILELVEKLPADFEQGAVNAHQRSVTVTLRFPAIDPFSQADYLDAVLLSSTVTGTLARNLRRERAATLTEGSGNGA